MLELRRGELQLARWEENVESTEDEKRDRPSGAGTG